MSELQKALLAIGLGAIIAVYAFGWWQQRRYRRKFGASFKNKTPQADALYQDNTPKPPQSIQPSAHIEQTLEVEDYLEITESLAAPVADELCAILNDRSDFIVELYLDEPSPTSVLELLSQRKFDFGKAVNICGLTLAGQQWERAIAESPMLYSQFRIALQLVDRGGLISSAKLSDFRDLAMGIAQHIQAKVTVPDVQKTMHAALQLDAFCVVVDQMVGVNLLPAGNRLLSGVAIAQAAATQGMTLESDGAFHLLNTHGRSQFSLINRDTQAFQPQTLHSFTTAGLTLLLDVPSVENPARQFDQMMLVAHALARALQVNLVDDRRVELTESGLIPIRAKVSEVEAKMIEQGIPPGSAQARRLFA
jgi:FtsZ-interacting cell division protein ZipA